MKADYKPDSSIHPSADAVYVATQTVSGVLRREVGRFIDLNIAENPNQQRNAVPWNTLNILLLHFLAAKKSLVGVKISIRSIKSPMNPMTLVLRFTDVAKDAYTDYEGNVESAGCLEASFPQRPP